MQAGVVIAVQEVGRQSQASVCGQVVYILNRSAVEQVKPKVETGVLHVQVIQVQIVA
jgi:hypothetical protein